MTGVAGSIGGIVALGIPMLVMRGDVGAMLGAINSLAGRFNNDPSRVRNSQAENLAAQQLAENEEARNYLRGLGIATPRGMGDLEYANMIRQGMDKAGQAYASMVATSSTHAGNYQSGAMAGAVNQAGNTIGLGMSGTSTSQALGGGLLQGKSQGINMQEQSRFTDNDDYYQGVSNQSRSGLEKTHGMGLAGQPSEKDWSDIARQSAGQFQERSEERRVGKEC